LFKQSVPLLQTLIWPLLIGLVLLVWREEMTGLLNRIQVIKVGDLELQVFAPQVVTPPSARTRLIEKVLR
jgi:hypothetical protein